MPAAATVDIMEVLRKEEDTMRYQAPKIEKHGKRRRVRVYVPERQPDGSFQRVRKSITLGTQDETASEIKRRAAALLGQVNLGTLIVQRQIKMAELLADYRETRLGMLAGSTQGKYRAHLTKIEAAFGSLELGELRPKMIEEWLSKTTAARATKADMRNVLSAVYSYARDMEMWSADPPTKHVKFRGDVEPREKYLITAAQLRDLCDELDRDETVVQGSITGSDVRLMVMIACVTTMRIGEILNLKAEDITPEGKVTIKKSKTEAGKRVVWLGALTDEVLARASKGLVFATADGERLDRRDLQQHVLRPAAKRRKIYAPGFGFHAFRRLSITLAQQANAAPFEVARQAGHADTKILMRYSLADSDRDRKRADKVSRLLAG